MDLDLSEGSTVSCRGRALSILEVLRKGCHCPVQRAPEVCESTDKAASRYTDRTSIGKLTIPTTANVRDGFPWSAQLVHRLRPYLSSKCWSGLPLAHIAVLIGCNRPMWALMLVLDAGKTATQTFVASAGGTNVSKAGG